MSNCDPLSNSFATNESLVDSAVVDRKVLYAISQ